MGLSEQTGGKQERNKDLTGEIGGMWSTEHPLCARPFLGTEETQGMRPKGCRWPCDGHAGSKQRHFGNRRNSECKGRGGWLLWKTGALAALRKYAER
nr:uncharacterized protein LOC129525813 isoform X3 [Gorilla gorilla gorilla]